MPTSLQTIQTELERAKTQLEYFRQALNAQLQENNRLKSILEHTPSGIALVDRAGIPFLNNRALSELLGYSGDELIKMSFAKFTHPDDLEQDLEYFNQLQKGEISGYSMEKRFIHKNGNIIWAYLNVTSYQDSYGKRQVLATVTEANSIKHLEQLIKKQHMELVDVNPGEKEQHGMVPVCSYCHKIRKEDGNWNAFEVFLRERFLTAFTHGICPECVEKELKKTCVSNTNAA